MTTDPTHASRRADAADRDANCRPAPDLPGAGARLVAFGAVAAVLSLGVVACSGEDDGAFATLPPIRTTTTTTTTTTTVSTERRFHVIQRGETLSIIAAQYGVPLMAIIELNDITNPDSIPAGATIEIPNDVVIVNQPGADDESDDEDPDDGDGAADDTSDDG